jgi:outer membrane receptor protein involved in Fe transport
VFPLETELKLTLGGRYYRFNNKAATTTSGDAFGSADPATTHASGKASGFNPKVNFAYAPTADSLYYIMAAKGFREGAGNPALTGGPVGDQCLQDLQNIGLSAVPLLYDPDKVWSYELGEKNRLFGGRMTVNGDVYFIDWSQIQTPVNLPCGLPFVENAGQAHITGGELEVQALVLPHLMLSQNVGYTHAYNTQDVPGAAVLRDQELFNVPRWTANTELRFEHPVQNGLRGDLTVTNSYVSSQTNLTYAINTIPARNLLGMRAAIVSASWTVELFADNLLNRQFAIENINLITFTGPPYNRVVSNQPRTIGLTVSFKL